ncbi:MAG: hypothetical protein AAB384_03265, partial [Patescibacteria group bacterium]
LLAALLAAIFTLACSAEGGTEPTPTDKVDGTDNPVTEFANLAIEIMGQPADAPVSRRLSPPIDTPNVVLIKDNDGSNIDWDWVDGLVTAKVPIGTYTCEVTFDGFLPETITLQVTPSDIGTTVSQRIVLVTNGPTKPEPVELGEYSVQWANWTPPDESSIGMFDDGGSVYVTYTPAFEAKPAQYQFHGDMPSMTCYVTEGRKVDCPTWTEQDGTLGNSTGEFTNDDAEATIKVDFTIDPGEADEYHKYFIYRIKRE